MKSWPKWVLDNDVLLAAIFLVLTIGAVYASSTVQFDFNFQEYFREGDATRLAYREQLDTFPSERSEFIVVVKDDSLFTSHGIDSLNKLRADLSSKRWAEFVHGPLNLPPGLFGRYRSVYEKVAAGGTYEQNAYGLLKEIVSSNPLVQNQLSFNHGNILIFRIPLKLAFSNDDGREEVRREIDETISGREDSFEDIYYTGHSGIRGDYAFKLKHEQRTYFPIAALVLIVGLVVFLSRSLIVFLPFACSSVAIFWTMAIMALQGDSFTILSSATPILILILGISDSLHVFAHLRQARETGLIGNEAINWTFLQIGRACLLASLTTAIGFAAFVLTDMPVLADFGYYTAIGIVFNFVAMMVLMPILLRRFSIGKSVLEPVRVIARVNDRVIHFLLGVLTRPSRSVVVSSIVILAIVVGIFSLREETKVYQGLSQRSELYAKIRTSESDLKGLLPMGITFKAVSDADFLLGDMLEAIDAVQQHLLAQDSVVGSVFSVIDIVKTLSVSENRNSTTVDWGNVRAAALRKKLSTLSDEFPETIESVVNLEKSELLLKCRLVDVGSAAFELFLLDLESTLKENAGAIQWKIAGIPNLSLRLSKLVVSYILLTFGATFLIIFIGFIYWFRSPGMAVISIIPNLIPLMAILGFLGWSGIPLQQSVAVIFSVVFGIAVNDTIHFLSRYERERRKNKTVALRATIERTAEPILLSSAILVSGFVVLMLSEFLGFVYLGLLLTTGILAALFGDLLVLPLLLSKYEKDS